jgi:hypothetical protein
MAVGLCAAMLFQPVSFAHYFLPAIALAAIAPAAQPRAGRGDLRVDSRVSVDGQGRQAPHPPGLGRQTTIGLTPTGRRPPAA